nr:MAG TPA: hypothetical protein [Bacteriophage sp.]
MVCKSAGSVANGDPYGIDPLKMRNPKSTILPVLLQCTKSVVTPDGNVIS